MIVFPEYMLHGLNMSTSTKIVLDLSEPEVKAQQQQCYAKCKMLGLLQYHGTEPS
jgi:hypothetical protein